MNYELHGHYFGAREKLLVDILFHGYTENDKDGWMNNHVLMLGRNLPTLLLNDPKLRKLVDIRNSLC